MSTLSNFRRQICGSRLIDVYGIVLYQYSPLLKFITERDIDNSIAEFISFLRKKAPMHVEWNEVSGAKEME